MRRSWNVAQRVDVGSACVDIGQSPVIDVLILTYSIVENRHMLLWRILFQYINIYKSQAFALEKLM